MKTEKTHIYGSFLVKDDIFTDERGSFCESYNAQKYNANGNIPHIYLQDNLSYSKAGVFRGLHIQRNNPQGKLIRCLKGSILDVIVELRPKSITFKKWARFKLDDNNRKALYVPAGCAHGFYSETDSIVYYKCTTLYDKESDGGINIYDPDLKIAWEQKEFIISDKDRNLPTMRQWLDGR